MINKIESWLLNVAIGKAVSRGAVLIAAYLSGPIVQGIAAQAGITLAVDQKELAGGLMLGANWLFEWFKARRAKNPASPAVQTNPALVAPPPAA